LPNLEDPARLIKDPKERPSPMGFGPIPRWWHPRQRLAGTYNDAWVKERAPLWPSDLDLRFFHAAPLDQQLVPWLRGGEAALLEGFAADGPIAFNVPTHRLRLRVDLRDRMVRQNMALDLIEIDPEAQELFLVWRAAVSITAGWASLRACLVRELESWEEL
jgi:hypothetical protein